MSRTVKTLSCLLALMSIVAVPAAQGPLTVAPIPPPATPLPVEQASTGVSRFSFVVYGDARSRHDGIYIQTDHLMVAEGIVNAVNRMKTAPDPIRFALFTGDAVVNGREPAQWNVSMLPVVTKITQDGGLPFFMTAGNHDVTPGLTVDAPGRAVGLKNFLDLNAKLFPPEGSAHRLSGYPTYGFGFGNSFFLTFDSNIAADDTQFAWVKAQLEGIDRTRYPNVFVFMHHPVFSSGPHGAVSVEPTTASIRATYMPLFNQHHVRAIFSGHEHLFEHWIEHYDDGQGNHRMDLVVTGGGGAPPYVYRGEPETRGFNLANHATMEHVVAPGPTPGDNPYHFVIVHVDGTNLRLEVVGVDWGSTFRPYRSNSTPLQ